MAGNLSYRSAATVANQIRPWTSIPSDRYHPEDNPDGIIFLNSASNVLVMDDLVEFAKNKVNFERSDFIYHRSLNAGKKFPPALAIHLNEYLHPHQPISPEFIRVVTGATSMHSILGWAMANPGEAFLTSRPVYGNFEVDLGNMSNVKMVYADTTAHHCFDEVVVEDFEVALRRSNDAGVKIRTLLIINPHNPTGKCYPRQTLINIMKFCQKHSLHLLSDELYSTSVFDSGEDTAVPFTSVLSIDPTGIIDPDLVHVEVGFSKDFAASGFRIASLVTRNRLLLAAIDTTTRFFEPSGPSLAIASAMLEDRDWTRRFVESSRQRLAAAYKHVTAGLRFMGVEHLSGTNAGFFVWIDLSPYLPTELDGEQNAEYALAKRLKAAGVFLNPCEEKSNQPGWFRLVYAQDADTITKALTRHVVPRYLRALGRN